jgi:sugar/nucleoside kinase (ribokinase family)
MTDPKPVLILSNVIIDDLQFADGSSRPHTPGGAALYAAIAASQWWDDVAVVAGVGADFHQLVGEALHPHKLRHGGWINRDPHTIQSKLVYSPDGERTETAVYGSQHFAKMQLTPADIPTSLLPAAGTYIFRDLWPAFWSAWRALRGNLGYVLWELQFDVSSPPSLEDIASLLNEVDAFSLNLAEARALLGPISPQTMVTRLSDAGGRLIVLRMGGEGSLVYNGEQLLHVAPPPSVVKDVTGGGNAFCGGFLAGLCSRPFDLEHAARCATASAAATIAQHGLPPANDRERLHLLYSKTVISRQTSGATTGIFQ